MKHVLFDSSPLGTLSNPDQTPEVIAISAWAADCDDAGHALYVPEVIDYEIRRELVRAGKSRRRGQPTSDPKKLDIDVILAAQVLLLPQNR